MKINRKSTMLPLAAFAVALVCLKTPTTANAQGAPPAQGPASPTASATGSLSLNAITATIKSVIDQKVSEENVALTYTKCIWMTYPVVKQYCFQAHKAVISASLQGWPASMSQTQYSDRPNQKIATIHYIATYTVSDIENYPFSRTITQSIEMDASCEQWYTGQGALTFTAKVQPAYLEGDHSFVEDAVGALLNGAIPSYVDSQIRQALSSFPSGSITNSTALVCSTLGVAPGGTAVVFDGAARVLNTSFLPQISVRIMQVRRLTTHDLTGAVVYYPLETPNIELYAGFSRLQLNLPQMVEGQVYIPPSNAVIQTPVPPDTGQLVLIGNTRYNEMYTEDSQFAVFTKASNFGNGTQLLSIPKTWSAWNSIIKKPIWYRTGGYELTLQITVQSPIVLGFN
jgi:hypothetical protein